MNLVSPAPTVIGPDDMLPPVKQAYTMLVYRVVLVDVNRTYIRVPQKRCGEPTVEHDLSTTFLTLPTPCEGSPAPPVPVSYTHLTLPTSDLV